jgi:hypothetical protein
MLGGPWNVPYLVAPWNVPCLVALEMNPMFGGQWETIFLGAQWKALSFVALGMFHARLPLEGEGETSFSSPSIFHSIKFYLNIFSLILRFFFTMVLNHYFTSFLHFP